MAEPQLDADGNVIEAPTTPDWEADDNPYKTRFETYRSEADRRATEFQQTQALLDDLQSDDAEKQRAAAQRLGFDLQIEDEDEGEGEGENALEARYAKLEARLEAQERKDAEREQARENEIVLELVNQRIADLGLNKADGDWVLARASMLEPGEDGLPDLKAAHQQLLERDQQIIEGYRKGKYVPPIKPGKSATQQKNILEMTDDERIDWATEQAELRAAARQ